MNNDTSTQNNDQLIKEDWTKPEMNIIPTKEETLGSTGFGADGVIFS